MKNTTAEASGNIVYAYEPDKTIKDIIGSSTLLADIFTKEKIAACQKMVDEAKNSFFDTAKPDMERIQMLLKDEAVTNDFQKLCRQIFQPACNIKGQADIFGFPLISRVCKYLIEYGENNSSKRQMTKVDFVIITKLVKALRIAFQEKIVDAGGALEKELINVIEQVRK